MKSSYLLGSCSNLGLKINIRHYDSFRRILKTNIRHYEASAFADNTNFCLNNSSYPARPHSIIVYYYLKLFLHGSQLSTYIVYINSYSTIIATSPQQLCTKIINK